MVRKHGHYFCRKTAVQEDGSSRPSTCAASIWSSGFTGMTSLEIQNYRSHQHYQPALYQGHHYEEVKLTVRPCGKTRRDDDHTPAHRALSQVAAIQTDSCPPGWCWRTGRPRNSWLHQIANGKPFGIRVEWNRVRRRGHTGTGLTQRTSAVYAIWWCCCIVTDIFQLRCRLHLQIARTDFAVNRRRWINSLMWNMQMIWSSLCHPWPEYCILIQRRYPLTSTWPHLNSDVGLDEGEY